MKLKFICRVILCFFALLFCLISKPCLADENFEPIYNDPDFGTQMPAISEDKQQQMDWLTARKKDLPPSLVLEKIPIQPDIKILDIGAGMGYFTLPFAKALNGTGKVYATDINEKRLAVLDQKAKNFGLKNIESVLVQPFGVDPFYKEHKFDLIFLSEVYFQMQLMQDTIDYFHGLLPSLNKNGKICILQPKDVQHLTAYIDPNDNAIFMKIFECLKKKENAPILNKLQEENKNFVLGWNPDGKTAIPLKKRKSILADLDNIINYKKLILEIVDSYAPKAMLNKWDRIQNLFPKSSAFMNWLAVRLLDNNAFLDDVVLDETNKKRVTQLNNLILQETLDIPDTVLFPIPNPLSNLLVSTQSIEDTMRRAGYTLDSEYEFKHHYLLIFKITP